MRLEVDPRPDGVGARHLRLAESVGIGRPGHVRCRHAGEVDVTFHRVVGALKDLTAGRYYRRAVWITLCRQYISKT